MEKVTVKVFRYDPSTDGTPRYESYQVPYEKGMRVLGILIYIQENIDTSRLFGILADGNGADLAGFSLTGNQGWPAWKRRKKRWLSNPCQICQS